MIGPLAHGLLRFSEQETEQIASPLVMIIEKAAAEVAANTVLEVSRERNN